MIAPDTPAIYTLALAKRYRTAVGLAGLDLQVPRGEVFGFLGPNGAGKTTAVKLLLGLIRPTGGEGWLLGAPIGDLATRRRIGYLPELFRYQEWLSAREVLALHCALLQMPRPDWPPAIDRALAGVGLLARGADRVGRYSKGMQQRLGLAVALLGEPELVLLDEPTSALDPVGRHEVREIIQALKRRGATVFLNSHLLAEVEMVCDGVAVIDHGRLIARGSLPELLVGLPVLRLRLEGLSEAGQAALARHGAVGYRDGWYELRGPAGEAVPALVAELAALGARIYAVEPRQQTLEERFLQLLKGASHEAADHSQAYPA